MEYPIGNIAGEFDYGEITCPRCDSNQVAVAADADVQRKRQLGARQIRRNQKRIGERHHAEIAKRLREWC